METKVTSAIQFVVRAVVKGIQSATFHSAGEGGVHEYVADPWSTDAAAAKLVDTSSFTVTVSKLVIHEVEKRSLHKTNMEEPFVKLAEAVEQRKMKVEDGIPTRRIDTTQSLSPLTDISEDIVGSPTTYSTAKSSDESDSRRYLTRGLKRKSRATVFVVHQSSLTHLTHKRSNFQTDLIFLVPVNKRYEKLLTTGRTALFTSRKGTTLMLR